MLSWPGDTERVERCNKTDVEDNEMGGSMSRIWNELCQIQSDEVRYHMLITTLSSPEYVAAAKRAGIYADVLTWVGA